MVNTRKRDSWKKLSSVSLALEATIHNMSESQRSSDAEEGRVLSAGMVKSVRVPSSLESTSGLTKYCLFSPFISSSNSFEFAVI